MVVQGLIWNSRGLKKRGVSTFLKNLILEHKFHFIGLQETMIAECEDSLLRKFDVNQDNFGFRFLLEANQVGF